MTTTVLREIIALLFGYRYYANIVATIGTTKTELCSYIFSTQEAAMRHRESLETTASFRYVETISFRSRKNYSESGQSKLNNRCRRYT